MYFTKVELQNWRNFQQAEIPLERRTFIVGPNASGKSNLLEAFRFLRAIAEPEGGFRRAVEALGGVSQIRCLHARRNPTIVVAVELRLQDVDWRYRLEFSQDSRRTPVVKAETVRRDGQVLLRRPDTDDKTDPTRLTQTHLEQINAHKDFRQVAELLARIRYLHIVPQLIRDAGRVVPQQQDPYGSDFLEQLATTPKKYRKARLKKINQALRVAVPQLKELNLDRDERGVPHLKGLYEHWRPNAGWQSEEHFSDGTLRLMGLLWAILDGDAPLLLEEPELSLHAAVVRHIPSMMARAAHSKKARRQILISTHSPELLSDEGIAPEEVVLLHPTNESTEVRLASTIPEVQSLLKGGISMADAVLPLTAPPEAAQLALFGT